MAYYGYPYIYDVPAQDSLNRWNGYNPYNSYYNMREQPKPPRPPMPEPPPVVCPKPDKDYYTYLENLDAALRLIEEAVMEESSDVKFYEAMMKLCGKEEKEIFEGILADEKKHAQLFRVIYCEITGQVLPNAPDEKITLPKSCCEGLQEAIFHELRAVEKYRRILYAMQNRRHINMLVEIITDEQKHADKLNYLFSKNDCGEKCRPRK